MRAGHPEHLGQVVKDRRQQLNLTLDGIKAAGGPTGPTLIRTEAGLLTDPRPSTLAKLDAALRWAPGSAARVYWEQGQPQHLSPSASGTRSAPATVELPVELVLKLLSSQRTLNDVADHARLATLDAVREDLNAHVSKIAGLCVTDLLERDYAEQRSATKIGRRSRSGRGFRTHG